MATQGQVTKIYQLKTLGYSDLSKELDNISKKFESIKKAKLGAEGQLAAAKDIADIKKYADEISRLKVQEQELRTERQKMINEQKAAQIARAEEIRQTKQQAAGVQAAAGSYAALYKEYRELYNLVKNTPTGSPVNFRGANLEFDQAINKLKELATAEQDFRRQFARDGLLVAEYTSGIVQAFKRMGLDDLVGGQVNKANDRLKDLNSQFNVLQQELAETRQRGEGSFESIEKQLIDNRKEAIALTQQVDLMKKELQGTGDVGTRLTNGLKQGFDSLKGQIGSFALQFVGIQALFNQLTTQISDGIADAKQIEGVEAAFNRLNNPDLLANLRVATRGTVSDLELMKNAVQANNFQIPVEQLGTLLDFARRRAKETGQEVDYLVQSIVTGIGRKSPLILDNLGISAVRLRENFKGLSEEQVTVGDVAAAVGKIIQEENAKAGAEIETVSENIAQNTAAWQNIRIEIASRLLPALVTLSSIFLLLIGNFPLLISLLSVLAIGWGVQNKQLLAVNARLLLLNARIVLNYVAIGILQAATWAYNAVLFVLNNGLKIVTASMRAFGIAVSAGTGPLGVILTIVSVLGAALIGLSRAMGSTIDNFKRSNIELRLTADIMQRVNESTSGTVSQIQTLTKVARDNNVSLAGRKKALEDLIAIAPEYLKGLTLENINTQEGINLINGYVKALREKAALQAAMAVRDEKLREDARLTTLELGLERKIATGGAVDFEDLTPEEQDFISEARKQFAFVNSVSDLITGNSFGKEALKAIRDQRAKLAKELDVTDDLIATKYSQQGAKIAEGPKVNNEVDIAKLKKDIEALDKQINEFKGSNADLQKLIAQRKKLQDELDRLLGNNRQSRQTKLQNTDPFRKIDAERDTDLAKEERRRLNNETNESNYLKKILAINQKAIDQKLDLLKGKDAEELKLRAQLQLEREKLEKDTNEKLRAITQKQFDDLVKDLQKQRDFLINEANQQAEEVANTPGATETQKAQARLDADKAILQATETYANQLDLLEEQIGFQSLQNTLDAAQAVRNAKIAAIQSDRELQEASLEDLQAVGERSIAEFRAIIATQRANIAAGPGSDRKKEVANANLDREENIGILAREVSNMQQQLPKYKQLLANKQITDQKYNDFITDLKNKEAQLSDSLGESADKALAKVRSIRELLQEGITDAFNIDADSEVGQAVGQALQQTYNLATDAMNNYFDAERDRIEQSKQLQLERLDVEKEQLLAKAQSKAEEESIERQAAATKLRIEREAFEKNKNIKKKEAKIAYLMELANIWSTAYQLGPVAGPIIGGILSGLATFRYITATNQISAQKFAYGGNPDMTTTRGGRLGGRPHSRGGNPFMFKGRVFEDEVDELNIIRTKNAPKNAAFTISGTQTQIASALNQIGGGVPFASGARVSKMEFGGNLGESLQAPVFMPSVSNTVVSTGSGISREDLNEFYSRMENIAIEQSRRIDRLQVVQDTKTVTDAQKKRVKQSEVATL